MEEKKLTEELRLAVVHFEDLLDPGIERSKQHLLLNVVVIALGAVIAGAESFYEIETFGQSKRGWTVFRPQERHTVARHLQPGVFVA